MKPSERLQVVERSMRRNRILEQLQSAHKAYGLVLSITTAPEAPERNEAARRARSTPCWTLCGSTC